MTSEYKLSKYKILRVVIQKSGKEKPEHEYRIIQVEGDFKRGKIMYILEVNKNKGYGWHELRRSFHFDTIKKIYSKWVEGRIIGDR